MPSRPVFAPLAGLRALWRARLVMRSLLASLPEEARPHLPWALRGALRVFLRPPSRPVDLAATLCQWGPSYIKLGQFLATRPDIMGEAIAAPLRQLQDKMPPFSQAEAQAALTSEFGDKAKTLFTELGEARAAASIAQVHRAQIMVAGKKKLVAVKILRPKIEAIFARDLAGFYQLARVAELISPAMRRLQLQSVLENLEIWVAAEMDLRLEAASLSELKDHQAQSKTRWHLPEIDWQRSGKRVLTLEWIDGISPSNKKALIKAGHQPEKIAEQVMAVFLAHALMHGFFHADMHSGNLFIMADGRLAAVDFGIMGRLRPSDRLALAQILDGLTRRDYRAAALAHRAAGYIPPTTDIDQFAHALRAIAEPIFARPAGAISMARLLAHLFETTGKFNMETRPGLLLLQKTMLAVEGLARQLDPEFDNWAAARRALTQLRQLGFFEGEGEQAPANLLWREAAAQALILLSRAPELLEAPFFAADRPSPTAGRRGLWLALALFGTAGAAGLVLWLWFPLAL